MANSAEVRSVADLNAITVSAIEPIEILRDGAFTIWQ